MHLPLIMTCLWIRCINIETRSPPLAPTHYNLLLILAVQRDLKQEKFDKKIKYHISLVKLRKLMAPIHGWLTSKYINNKMPTKSRHCKQLRACLLITFFNAWTNSSGVKFDRQHYHNMGRCQKNHCFCSIMTVDLVCMHACSKLPSMAPKILCTIP